MTETIFSMQGVLHSIFCNRLLLNIRGAYKSVSVAVCSIRSGAQTQVLDTVATVSEFSASSTLPLRSRGDVEFDLGCDNEDEEF